MHTAQGVGVGVDDERDIRPLGDSDAHLMMRSRERQAAHPCVVSCRKLNRHCRILGHAAAADGVMNYRKQSQKKRERKGGAHLEWRARLDRLRRHRGDRCLLVHVCALHSTLARGSRMIDEQMIRWAVHQRHNRYEAGPIRQPTKAGTHYLIQADTAETSDTATDSP